MSIKNFLLNNKSTYKLYLYYNLYIKNFYKKKTGYYSQWGEDRYISEFFKNKKKGFYFDIGCYHPIKYSNTCLLYKNGWSGVNIDANRTSIDLFNIARPKDNNICAAISDNNNLTEYFVDNINPFLLQQAVNSVINQSSGFNKAGTLTLESKSTFYFWLWIGTSYSRPTFYFFRIFRNHP